MTDDRIRDIPKLRYLLTTAQVLSQFDRGIASYRGVLQELGVDVDHIEAVLETYDLDELTDRAEHLTTLPDRFNDQLGSAGWIMYGDMNLDVAETAVGYAEAGDLDAAERVLIEYYDAETVGWHINRLASVGAFRPRQKLVERALTDYDAGRYHACIPVVLAQLDGMVQHAYPEGDGESRGFASNEAKLEAWDSIAGHATGLEYLQDLMLQGRKTTRTEEIDKPYRNGILHGMDLGYATERVAAKTWGALFAAGEWARKAENDELDPPAEDTTEQTIRETLEAAIEQHKETQDAKQAMDAWEPRDVVVGREIPTSGTSEDYTDGTPERAVVDFLLYWEDGNYGKMASSLITSDGETEHPGDLRREFEHLELLSFELVDIEEKAPAQRTITVTLEVERFGESISAEESIVVTRVGVDGRPAVPEHEDGTWTITNHIVLTTL
jgi:hypothetical protein